MGKVKNHNSQVVKSAGKPTSTREVRAAHNRSFRNLHDVIEKKYGLPGDEVPYWDPMGFHTGGKALNLKKALYKEWEPVYEEINEVMRENPDASFREVSKDVVQKAIGRGSFSIPIFFTPDVYQTADNEDLPFSEMVARVAVNEDTIQVDERIDIGDAQSFAEASEGGDWAENDDQYDNHEYDVYSYGRRNNVDDFVQLSASGLRSTQAITEEAQVVSIRQYEERQFLQGKGDNTSTSEMGNDSADTAYPGLLDIVADPSSQIEDAAEASMTISRVRDLNTRLRREGNAARERIVHFTDHTTFKELQSDLTDFTRYESPGDELDFGFESMIVDNTRVVETHGLPDTDGQRAWIGVDMGSIYAGMLQDITMHPLSRDEPAESFATDAYGSLVGESTRQVYAMEGLA